MIEEILQEAEAIADQRNHEVIMTVLSERLDTVYGCLEEKAVMSEKLEKAHEYNCLEEKMQKLLEQIDHQNWIFNLPSCSSEAKKAWKERQEYMDELKLTQLKMLKCSSHQFFS
jgi:translation initiation factor IF-2